MTSLARGLAAALLILAPSTAAVAQGLCRFDEVAFRLPAGQAFDWLEGHHDKPEVAPFVFAMAGFAMHSGGVRMDEPRVEGVDRYVSYSKQADERFTWNGDVFAMARGEGLGLPEGRRILVVRRADPPVVDVMLGSCSEEGFDRDAFEEEYFTEAKRQRESAEQ